MISFTSPDGKSIMQIRPEAGGQVAAIVLDDVPVIETSGNSAEDEALFRGKILFPFNDRIPEGRYRFSGKSYRFPINEPSDGSAIHGLLYKEALKEVKMERFASGAVKEGKRTFTRKCFEYNFSDRFQDAYPFDIFIKIFYDIGSENCRGQDVPFATLHFEIKNEGLKSAPVALGWHPYYALYSKNGNRLPSDAFFLTADFDRYVEVGKDLLPTGNILPVRGSGYDFTSEEMIGNREIDIALGPAFGDNQMEMILKGEDYFLRIVHSSFFQYLQMFIPPDRMSVALEPVSGATNAFNRPDLGLKVLKPGEVINADVTVYLHHV